MKTIKIFKEILKDTMGNVSNFINSNIKNVAEVLNLLLPYIMYTLGTIKVEAKDVNAEVMNVYIVLVLPIIVFFIIYLLRSYANKIGKGSTVPIPEKRFTEIDEESGEVSVEQDRLQELILYTADLEDWIKKKGLSRR